MTGETNNRYLLAVGEEHRKKFAQFFTPAPVARFMCDWTTDGNSCRGLLDPAFGLGAFFENCGESVEFHGIDIDERAISFFLRNATRAPSRLEKKNYLLDFSKVKENVVCNPPYLRFQNFADRENVFQAFREHFGITLSGYTNTASAFLVKSVLELSDTARLSYIMPSEFLNAGYGKQVKEILLSRKRLQAIIQIECEEETFPDAMTSLCILLYDNARESDSVSFYSVASLDSLENVLSSQAVRVVPVSELQSREKWGVYFQTENFLPSEELLAKTARLSDYGAFKRGIATGANDFFVMNRSIARSLSIPDNELLPCITKSAQIRSAVFTDRDFEALSSRDESVYVFCPGVQPSPSAQRYISIGEGRGFCNGYITRKRTPWHKMEHRDPSPIMLNVFSRGGYRIVRNLSKVVSLTPYHCFYPNLFGAGNIDSLFLYLQSNPGRKLLSSSVRKYGRGLMKFEPGDLNGAIVPSEDFFNRLDKNVISDLMKRISNGNATECQEEIDSLFADFRF